MALVGVGLLALVCSGAITSPRSDLGYYKRITGIWREWTVQVNYLNDPPTSRGDSALRRLQGLRPPAALEGGHEELMHLLERTSRERAAGQAEEGEAAQSQRFADLRAARRLREELVGAATEAGGEDYGANLAALARSSQARLDQQAELALDATSRAVASLQQTRVPSGCETDHERLMAALGRYRDVIRGYHDALTSLDEDEMRRAEALWQSVAEETQLTFERVKRELDLA